MPDTIGEFDHLVQSLLKNKLKSYGHTFSSEEALDKFIKDNIHLVTDEDSGLQQYYLGNPQRNGILLFTYKIK